LNQDTGPLRIYSKYVTLPLYPGRIAREANEEYQRNPKRYCHGKSVLTNLKGKIQKEISNNPNLFKPTKFLKDTYLEREAKNIWKK